jgi:hypothetical protein
MGAGQKIIDGLRDAVDGNISRVDIEGQTWIRRELADQCPACDAKAEIWWNYCAMCGRHIAAMGLK